MEILIALGVVFAASGAVFAIWIGQSVWNYFFTDMGKFWRLAGRYPGLALLLLSEEQDVLIEPKGKVPKTHMGPFSITTSEGLKWRLYMRSDTADEMQKRVADKIRAQRPHQNVAAEKEAQPGLAKAGLRSLMFILSLGMFVLCFWQFQLGWLLSLLAAAVAWPLMLVGIARLQNMPRYMPQALFDSIAITYLMCAVAPEPERQPMIEEWDRLLKHYVDGPYKSEDYSSLRCELLEAAAVVRELTDWQENSAQHIALLKGISDTVVADKKNQLSFVKRIFGGTLFVYEKKAPTNRVGQCRQDVIGALLQTGRAE